MDSKVLKIICDVLNNNCEVNNLCKLMVDRGYIEKLNEFFVPRIRTKISGINQKPIGNRPTPPSAPPLPPFCQKCGKSK